MVKLELLIPVPQTQKPIFFPVHYTREAGNTDFYKSEIILKNLEQNNTGQTWNIGTRATILWLIKLYWKVCFRTSLVAQWLRIHLPVRGTRVWSLVWEDPTCHGAAKPTCHNCWACAPEPASHNCWACAPQLRKRMRLEPVLRNKRSHCNEKPVHSNEE